MDKFERYCKDRRKELQDILDRTHELNTYTKVKLQSKIDEITTLMHSYNHFKLGPSACRSYDMHDIQHDNNLSLSD